jgi:hypothetical protein
MALLPGKRIRNNGITGTIANDPLTNGATSLNSPALANLGIVSGDHAIITLDPLREYGEPEIVMVTEHSSGSAFATIQRGMYGTVARQHPVDTLFVHAATNDDFSLIATNSTRPVDVWKGQSIFESDTLRPAYYNGTQWMPGSGVIVCTSGTRPTTPFTGQAIYETDSNLIRVWNGTAWSAHTNLTVATSGARPSGPYTGQAIYETDTNLIKTWNGSNWVTQGNLKMFNTGAALVGSPPAIDTGSVPFKIQAGTIVFTTDGSGYFTIVLPTAFPGGMVAPFAQAASGGLGAWWLYVTDGGFSASQFQVRAFTHDGNSANNSMIRASWMAIGW